MDVSEVTVLGCGHAVCGSCLEKWAKDEGGWPTLHAQERYAHLTPDLPACTSVRVNYASACITCNRSKMNYMIELSRA